MGKEVRSSQINPISRCLSNRSATGAAIVGATPGKTILVASVLIGNSARCLADTIINTPIHTLATISKQLTCKQLWVFPNRKATGICRAAQGELRVSEPRLSDPGKCVAAAKSNSRSRPCLVWISDCRARGCTIQARGSHPGTRCEQNWDSASFRRKSAPPTGLRGLQYRIVGNLPNTDFVMNNVFWIGIYPGLTTDMLDFVAGVLKGFVNRKPDSNGASRIELDGASLTH